tara:strand:- start:12 stop:443 length:432 start_codon:yes stop_codon:yes gene_type:complete
MSEERKVVSYDFTKVIKDVVVSTAFIPGLQNVYYRYISEFYNDASEMGDLVSKFHGIIDGTIKGDDATLTPLEHEIYTVFSLTHLFKSFAKDQNLEQLSEIPVDDEKLKEFAEEAKKKGSLVESMQHLAKKIDEYKPDEEKKA